MYKPLVHIIRWFRETLDIGNARKNKYERERSNKNLLEHREYGRNWMANHPQKRYWWKKLWAYRNHSHVIEYSREWRESHKEHVAEYNRQYRLKKKEERHAKANEGSI
jgi:hypothetical protein